ncbi:hypothetical protein Mal15_17800 [Stieleria maiorica]|uniref:Uncharacterized protein n=1 Tax=Stieleria maiorica TaxID=2795974 RepID=A0A5B9MC06_9BACT|nr:hypothetical protein Mal15_17800 [Stieleria maiorica]
MLARFADAFYYRSKVSPRENARAASYVPGTTATGQLASAAGLGDAGCWRLQRRFTGTTVWTSSELLQRVARAITAERNDDAVVAVQCGSVASHLRGHSSRPNLCDGEAMRGVVGSTSWLLSALDETRERLPTGGNLSSQTQRFELYAV